MWAGCTLQVCILTLWTKSIFHVEKGRRAYHYPPNVEVYFSVIIRITSWLLLQILVCVAKMRLSLFNLFATLVKAVKENIARPKRSQIYLQLHACALCASTLFCFICWYRYHKYIPMHRSGKALTRQVMDLYYRMIRETVKATVSTSAEVKDWPTAVQKKSQRLELFATFET